MDERIGNVYERVWLVSTSSLWIAGFQGLFGDPCGVDGVQVTLSEALTLKGPQIVLIDVSATNVEGKLREVLLLFRRWVPELRPIVISHETGDDDEYIEGLIQAGAKGYLGASASTEEFTAALETVRDGSLWAPRRNLSHLVELKVAGVPRPPEERSHLVKFTPREDQVIRMLVGGRGNREIGQRLGIDPVTVKAHLGRIMRKAGVGNRIELTMFALSRRRAELAQNRRLVDGRTSLSGPQESN